MKRLIPFACLIAVLGFFACTDKKKAETTQIPAPAVSSPAPSASENTSAQPAASTIAAPATGTAAAPVTVQATGPASGEALNPAHGQPGHRCEIPVGAPLSSAPPQTAASASPSQPATLPTPQQGSTTQKVELQQSPPSSGNANTNMVSPTPAASTTVAPGMNPPHGQPGHDCNIPVGSPLKK